MKFDGETAVMGVAIALGTATLVNAYKNLEQRLLDSVAEKKASAPATPVSSPMAAAAQQWATPQPQWPAPAASAPPTTDVVAAMQELFAEQERATERKLEALRTELAAQQQQQQQSQSARAPPSLTLTRAPSVAEDTIAEAESSASGPAPVDDVTQHYLEENRRLQEQLSDLRRETWRRGLLVDLDGPRGMSPEEEDEVRRIFDMFDHNRNGCIAIKEVQALHLKMGEPLTDKEAEEALKEMGGLSSSGGGSPLKEVSFDLFVTWWKRRDEMALASMSGGATPRTRHGKVGKRGGFRYTKRFKLMMTKLLTDFDASKVSIKHKGEPGTTEYRMHFMYTERDTEREISPWHDIPLFDSTSSGTDGTLNFICEIPKWTRPKMEVATGEQYNPIKQDTKNGLVRSYGVFPLFNYGAFPQTWEDPAHTSEDTGCIGDNDPLDVVEIGTTQLTPGAVVKVKVLGVFAMIDDGETDWKVVTIAVNDERAGVIDDVDDIERYMPGTLSAMREWFRVYKVPEGKAENGFALGERCMPKAYAMSVIADTHNFWKRLALRTEPGEPTAEGGEGGVKRSPSGVWRPQDEPDA